MAKYEVEINIKKFRNGVVHHIELFETKIEAQAYIEYMKREPHFMGHSLRKIERGEEK